MAGDYLIRATGLLAWYLLVIEVMIGALMTGGLARATFRPTTKNRWHARVSLALLIAIAAHIYTIWIVGYQGWTEPDTLWVITGPMARDVGVGALWLFLVVYGTSLLRRWLPKKLAKRLHEWVPLGVLALATLHGLAAGNWQGAQLPILVPGVAALTFVVSVFIVRGNVHLTRKRSRNKVHNRNQHLHQRKKER